MDWSELNLKGKKIGLIREDNRVCFILKRELSLNDSLSISKEVVEHLEKIKCFTISLKSTVTGHEGDFSINLSRLKRVSELIGEEYLIPFAELKNSSVTADFKPTKPINNLLIY